MPALDAEGVLDHHVGGVDHVEQAMETPPRGSRASLRGQMVRRLASEAGGRYLRDWQRVYDMATPGRYLDVTDPFDQEERWTTTLAPARPSESAPTVRPLPNLLDFLWQRKP